MLKQFNTQIMCSW